MINPEIEKFLEENDMAYMFCLLSNLEVERLNKLPQSVRNAFDKPITEVAMEHVARNFVPDYMFDVQDDNNEDDNNIKSLFADDSDNDEFDESDEIIDDRNELIGDSTLFDDEFDDDFDNE